MGISEHSAVLLNGETGTAELIGAGPIYFLKTLGRKATQLEEGKPLSWVKPGVSLSRWKGSQNTTTIEARDNRGFDFATWQPVHKADFDFYALFVDHGKLGSTQRGGRIY